MLLTKRSDTGPGRVVRVRLSADLALLVAEYAIAAGYDPKDPGALLADAIAYVVRRDREFQKQRGGKNGNRS